MTGPPVMAFFYQLSNEVDEPGLNFLVFGTYPITVWIAYLLIGMGIGRLQIQKRTVAAGLLGVGMALSFAAYGLATLAPPAEPEFVAVPTERVNPEGFTCEVATAGDEIFCYPADDMDYVTMPAGQVNLDGFKCEVATGWDEVRCHLADVKKADSGGVASTGGNVGEDGSGVRKTGFLEHLSWKAIREALRDSVVNASPHSGGILDIVGSAGFAAATLGVCLLLTPLLRWPLLPIATLGSMPLTVYSVHALSVMVIAGGPGKLTEESNGLWLWSVLVLTLGAVVWSISFGKGPFERLVAHVGAVMARPPRVK